MERLEKLKEFLAANPDDSFVQHAIALEYIKANDDVRARQFFENLLSANPGYIGSYYHLAKLMERNNDKEGAMAWYQKGMDRAKEAGDHHAFIELRAAYDELND